MVSGEIILPSPSGDESSAVAFVTRDADFEILRFGRDSNGVLHVQINAELYAAARDFWEIVSKQATEWNARLHVGDLKD